MIPGAMAPPAALVSELKIRYREPHRAYHTWQHIEALLEHFVARLHLVHNRTAVLWAILWHDAIYDPRRNDNEQRSALLLREQATSLLDPADLALSETLIRATTHHELAPMLTDLNAADCAAFLDFDLSILAAPEPVFDAYEAQIRQEYQHVPEQLFCATRATILRRLAARPSLYFTPELIEAWEQPARSNLLRSIARLSS